MAELRIRTIAFHGSQLLAVVMDRRRSFSRFGSSKLPRFHRCLKGGDSSHLRALDEQCLHQSGKAFQHDSQFDRVRGFRTLQEVQGRG